MIYVGPRIFRGQLAELPVLCASYTSAGALDTSTRNSPHFPSRVARCCSPILYLSAPGEQ
jgi:hypothetical protein